MTCGPCGHSFRATAAPPRHIRHPSASSSATAEWCSDKFVSSAKPTPKMQLLQRCGPTCATRSCQQWSRSVPAPAAAPAARQPQQLGRQQLSRCLQAPAAAPPSARRQPDLRGVAAAATLSMSGLGGEMRQSLDPMAASWAQPDWEGGRLLTIKSPQQFEELLAQHSDKLVVLMCKSHSCRPCKMFTRKYMSMAAKFPEVVMAEVFGDETPELRKFMIQLAVKVTPTFRLYRGSTDIDDASDVITGTNEKKLLRGLLAQLRPAELISHEKEIAESMDMEEGEAAAAAAAIVSQHMAAAAAAAAAAATGSAGASSAAGAGAGTSS